MIKNHTLVRSIVPHFGGGCNEQGDGRDEQVGARDR